MQSTNNSMRVCDFPLEQDIWQTGIDQLGALPKMCMTFYDFDCVYEIKTMPLLTVTGNLLTFCCRSKTP